jgi:hypothetical protein
MMPDRADWRVYQPKDNLPNVSPHFPDLDAGTGDQLSLVVVA